jgi:hypothetical protein
MHRLASLFFQAPFHAMPFSESAGSATYCLDMAYSDIVTGNTQVTLGADLQRARKLWGVVPSREEAEMRDSRTIVTRSFV